MKKTKFYDIIVEMDEDRMNRIFEKIEKLEEKFPGWKITFKDVMELG